MADKEDPFLTLIKRRHPEYLDRKAHWDFLDSCYEGGREWFAPNIFRYMKEGDEDYKGRLERAYRFNHSREIVDLLNKYLFRQAPQRAHENVPNSVEKFWASSTKAGQDIEFLMRQISQRASTLGRIYVVVDTNRAGEMPISIRDEKNHKIKTYAYVVQPQDALDMSFDDMDKLNWILIKEKSRDDTDPFTSDGDVKTHYRLWTRDEWSLYEAVNKDGSSNDIVVSMVDSGKHDLGEVPVIVVDHLEHDSLYYSPALINDIAYLDRAVANYLSNLDEIIQSQTFSQLAMPAQGLMPGEEADVRKKLMEMGTKRIFLYNAEGGLAPQYLSPDPRQATLIITAIKQVINEIYHTVGMAGERTKQDNSLGIDNSSGVAKAYDFEKVSALLASKADAMERTEKRLVHLVKLWNGDPGHEEDTDILVKYPDSFDIRSLLDDLEIANQLALIDAPDVMRQEQMKTVMSKLFPTVADVIEKQMLTDIKDWPAEPEPSEFDAPNTSPEPDEGSQISRDTG